MMVGSTGGSSAPRRTTGSAGGWGEDGLDGAGGPVDEAFQLLDVLVDAPSGGTGVREIARRLSLPVSSVHRLLGTLLTTDMVSRDDETRRYSVGPKAYRLAARITGGMRLSEFALPALRRLTAEFNETALLGLHLGQHGKMMFCDRVDGTHFLQYRISLLGPLSVVWGASGKAILAFLRPEVVDAILQSEGPAPATGSPPPRRGELLDELDVVRRQGVAVSRGEKIPNACASPRRCSVRRASWAASASPHRWTGCPRRACASSACASPRRPPTSASCTAVAGVDPPPRAERFALLERVGRARRGGRTDS